MDETYQRSAELYDRMYEFKDFAAEAVTVRRLITARCPQARTVLDVGCGTGAHLAHLRDWAEIEGVDASESMVEVARRRLPGVSIHTADMRTFRLERRFDAVVCLFSAIGYMRSFAELSAAVTNMARHLAPGGVLLVEPWFTPEQWNPGVHGKLLVDQAELKVARFTRSETRGRFSVMPMHHLVASPAGVDYFIETHEMFLAEKEEMKRAFEDAGLKAVDYVPDVLIRGAWMGTHV